MTKNVDLSDRIGNMDEKTKIETIKLLEFQIQEHITTILSKNREIEDRDDKIEHLKYKLENEKLKLRDENHELKEMIKKLEGKEDKKIIDAVF